MLKALLYKFDIFKTPFLLRTDSKERTSTILGFIISIGVIIFLSIFFSNSDIFHHRRPNINDQTIQLAKKERFDLNSENFHFVVGITDDLGLPFQDDSLFKLSLKQIRVNSSSKESSQEDKYFHICNYSDFNDPNEFTINGFKDYFCLDDNNIVLEGGWDEDIVSYFSIKLEMCNNHTFNNECKDPEFILNKLTDKYISIYFKEAFYDLNNYENPFNSGYKNQYWSLGSKIRKVANIYLKKIEIFTDDGYIFENSISKISFKQDEVSYDLDLNYEIYLIEVDFYSSYRKQSARRSYQKFQEIIAGMGGIFSFLLHLGYFFTITQNSLNRINLIMNQLYTFPKLDTQDDQKKNANFKCNKKINRNKLKSKNLKKINLGKFAVNQNKIKESDINEEKISTQTQKSIIIFSPSNLTSNENNCNNNDCSIIIDNCENSKENTFKQNDDFDNQRNDPSKYFNELDIGKIKNIKRTKNSLNMKQKDINVISNSKTKQKNILFSNNETNQSKKDNNLKILQNKYVKTSKFHFSLFNLYVLRIKKIFRLKLNYKEKLYIKTEKVFLKEVDLTSILMRLHEISKIKLLLFNERQISLLNLLSKPMIFLKNTSILKNSINNGINTNNASYRMSTILKSASPKIKNKDKINEQYQETLNKINESEIDRKLIKFLDDEASKITFFNKN